MLEDAARGQIDQPSRRWLAHMMGEFDWDARSRVVERDGALASGLLVMDRVAPEGMVTRLVEAGAGAPNAQQLRRWGMGLSAAVGAWATQVWRVRGQGQGLAEEGFAVVRPFWRMDRAGLDSIADAPLPDGYRMATQEDGAIPDETWLAAFNGSFADHWRHSDVPLEAWDRRRGGRDPGLSLMALRDDEPAAVVRGAVDEFAGGERLQPVGVVEKLGTLPPHRRRGLGAALTTELLRRLRQRGAASASLYVDGLNPSGAPRLYRRLHFELGLELDVWEYEQVRRPRV